jgi:hypothetical protein
MGDEAVTLGGEYAWASSGVLGAASMGDEAQAALAMIVPKTIAATARKNTVIDHSVGHPTIMKRRYPQRAFQSIDRGYLQNGRNECSLPEPA